MNDFGLFQTVDPIMTRVLESARAMAMTPAPILISGEQGTGKQLLVQFLIEKARYTGYLHRFSALHCENIADSVQDGEAIVIEDLDSMNLMQQAVASEMIDQVKQRGLRVRWMATSTASPHRLVNQGVLRKDLFYRLSVLHFEIPPLRNRLCDVAILSEFFCRVFNLMKNRPNQRLSQQAQAKLLGHSWPGNVSELENVIERAVAMTEGDSVPAEAICFAPSETENVSFGTTLGEMEKKLILQTLQLTQQNKTRAAQILGISIRTLRNKLNEYRGEGMA